MAKNETISLAAGAWVEATGSDVAAVRIQNCGGYPISVMATVDASAPISDTGAIVINPGAIIAADMDLAALFPGVVGAARVWVLCSENGLVSVSHA